MTEQGTPVVDWASLAAQAQPTRRRVRLCLRGDLLADLASAQDTGDNERAEALRDEIDANTVEFVLRGLTQDKYRALIAAHPDPDGSAWNDATFPEALVRACILTPTVGPSDPLFTVLTAGQVEQLFTAAIESCIEVDAAPLPKRG
jgi:hypothetical protein